MFICLNVWVNMPKKWHKSFLYEDFLHRHNNKKQTNRSTKTLTCIKRSPYFPTKSTTLSKKIEGPTNPFWFEGHCRQVLFPESLNERLLHHSRLQPWGSRTYFCRKKNKKNKNAFHSKSVWRKQIMCEKPCFSFTLASFKVAAAPTILRWLP